jgi:hypothetical protein
VIRHGANTTFPTAGTSNCVLIAGASSGVYQTSGAVQIEGGQATGSCDIQIGRARTDAVQIGAQAGGSSYGGIPAIFNGFAAFGAQTQSMVAGDNFASGMSYLKISSSGAIAVSGNFAGSAPADGSLMIIRNIGSFTITIPAAGSIRTLGNGAKALAAGGGIFIQYDTGIGGWYEISTVLNAS